MAFTGSGRLKEIDFNMVSKKSKTMNILNMYKNDFREKLKKAYYPGHSEIYRLLEMKFDDFYNNYINSNNEKHIEDAYREIDCKIDAILSINTEIENIKLRAEKRRLHISDECPYSEFLLKIDAEIYPDTCTKILNIKNSSMKSISSELENFKSNLKEQYKLVKKQTSQDPYKFDASDSSDETEGLLPKNTSPRSASIAKERGNNSYDIEFESFCKNEPDISYTTGTNITSKITQQQNVNWCLMCCLLSIAASKNSIDQSVSSWAGLLSRGYKFSNKDIKNPIVTHIFNNIGDVPCKFGNGFDAQYLRKIISNLKLGVNIVSTGSFPYPAGFSFPINSNDNLIKKYILYKLAKWANDIGQGKSIILHGKKMGKKSGNHYTVLHMVNKTSAKVWDPHCDNDISNIEIFVERKADRKIVKLQPTTQYPPAEYLGYIALL